MPGQRLRPENSHTKSKHQPDSPRDRGTADPLVEVEDTEECRLNQDHRWGRPSSWPPNNALQSIENKTSE